jgi:hypothetical protein
MKVRAGARGAGIAALQRVLIDFPRLRSPWSNVSLVGGWAPESRPP